MDKSWIEINDRTNPAFLEGLKNFMEYLKNYLDEEGKTRCPCKKCCNTNSYNLDTVYAHIHDRGFQQFYTTWVYHGERYPMTSAARKLSASHKRKTPSTPTINNEMFDVIEDVNKNGGPLEIDVDDSKGGGTYKFVSNMQHYYDLSPLEARDDSIRKDCAKRYSSRKSKFGAHFRLHGGGDSPDRAKKNPPPKYNVEKWSTLIDDLFNTPKWLNRSKKNSINRKKVPFVPLCGSESYSQKRYLREVAGDSEPIQVWYDSHYSSDWEDRGFDGFETADAEATWHAICDERDRRWREVGVDGYGYVNEMDVLRCVLGETPKYVRGVGQKISTSSSGTSVTSSRQRLQLEQQNETIQHLQQQQAEMSARMEEQVNARLEEQRKEMEKQMEKKMKKQQKKLKKQMKEEMKKMLKQMKKQQNDLD